MDDWPFDQAPSAAAITTRQVVEDGLPILGVVHYSDDHSWAFVCRNSDLVEDARVIGMGTALQLDQSLAAIADLPPGWRAHRNAIGEPWIREPNLDAADD